MKQIEVNTHSDRIELESEAASALIDTISKMTDVSLIMYDIDADCTKYTELGQAIFNDIVDVISKYIKVKEE